MKHSRKRMSIPWWVGIVLASALTDLHGEATDLQGPPAERATGQVLYIVGATFMQDYTAAVMEHLEKEAGLPPAIITTQSATRAIDLFCAGIGLDTPDIAVVSRRIHAAEIDACADHGVRDIVEIPIGYEAAAMVSRRDDQAYPLTLGDLYHAVAAELPRNDNDFVPNRVGRWREIDKNLPDTEIHFIVPVPSLGGRSFFEDRILQGACRNISEIRSIFSASARVKQCVALRGDGRVIELDTPYDRNVVQTLASAPLGTLAMLPLRFVTEHQEFLTIQPLDGVMPNYETVANHRYFFTRPLYFLVKKAHVRNYQQQGLVAGLREFVTEITRESTIGPSGYLAALGVFPMESEVRDRIREVSLQLNTISRY